LHLKNEFIDNKNHYYIIVKLDSDEILGDVELTHLYANERSKKAFIMTVWQYVIHTKIFQQISLNRDKINLKDKEMAEVEDYHKTNKNMFDHNFYGMILYISKQFENQNILQDPSLLEKIKAKLFPMINIVNNFFEKRKIPNNDDPC